ncbi:MAG TPA: VOC family protein [Crenalkalicoccus sp.]|nr:VOC family protein [Crenalkalicoccus sp.]
MSLGPLLRLELPCRDPARQREFYGRVLGLEATDPMGRFALGPVELVLRARGDALFPQSARGGGALLGFAVSEEELERWHRRMLTVRAAVMDAPGPGGAPPRLLRVADPEGNVIELRAA